VPLAATLYEPSSGPGPGVVLVHMHLRTRRDWDAVGERLASNGIAALALDLRGHGDSGVGRFDTTTFTGAVADVRAAVLYLKVRRDLVNGGIGIAGASVGANLAVLEAAAIPSSQPGAPVARHGLPRLRIEAAVRSFGARQPWWWRARRTTTPCGPRGSSPAWDPARARSSRWRAPGTGR